MAEGGIIDIDSLEEENGRLIFQSLSGILPDADPSFLQLVSSKFTLNMNGLNTYIEEILSSKQYPKKKDTPPDVPPPVKVNNSHRNSVIQFLEKFQDPRKYFSERNVGGNFVEPSKNYLKDRYKFLSVKTINKVFTDNGFNLTKSKQALDMLRSDRISKRARHELLPFMNSVDENFLDEVYFLDNEVEIQENLSGRAEILRQRLENAKLNKELLECQCCFNDEVFGVDVITCNEGHIFCKDCVKRSVEIAFSDGKTEFWCLANCEGRFIVEMLKGLLYEPLYNKIMSKIQEEEIKSADISGICFCPYCEYAEVYPDSQRVFSCISCKKESCRFCREENHIPLSCEEFENEKNKSTARVRIENKMTEALVRECYKCKMKFIKQDGCNKMVCICGAMMCYICRQPVQDYSHFQDQNRAPLSEASSSKAQTKCPLWSQNKKLHIDAVVEAARSAAADMERENPAVHIETNQLLKGLKRKIA